MHPVWSPAGDRIAFVTDRFTTDLERLRYGDYQLALIDPVSREITSLPAFSRGKHTNPQWAPDGASLYFLSDRTGVTNVYRIHLPEGQVSQVTDLYTGVSGITALSPALSVASGTGRVAVTIYEKGSYSIYRIDDADVLRGRHVR